MAARGVEGDGPAGAPDEVGGVGAEHEYGGSVSHGESPQMNPTVLEARGRAEAAIFLGESRLKEGGPLESGSLAGSGQAERAMGQGQMVGVAVQSAPQGVGFHFEPSGSLRKSVLVMNSCPRYFGSFTMAVSVIQVEPPGPGWRSKYSVNTAFSL